MDHASGASASPHHGNLSDASSVTFRHWSSSSELTQTSEMPPFKDEHVLVGCFTLSAVSFMEINFCTELAVVDTINYR